MTHRTLKVTLTNNWNALYRQNAGDPSALEHSFGVPAEWRRCCLGEALRQICPTAELRGVGLPSGLPTQARRCWQQHTSLHPSVATPPEQPGVDVNPLDDLEEAIAELNDAPYHFATTPERALHQLTYLFSLVGLDLVVPDDIRIAYVKHWTHFFLRYQHTATTTEEPV